MLLLELHMKPMSDSHGSCRSIRTPVNLGAFFLKLGSVEAHCSYSWARFGSRLK